MKVLALLPPREIPGAEYVLEGLVVEVTSGNLCRIWPAITGDENQTRIAFFMEWRNKSTAEDEKEITAYTNELMGKAPEFVAADDVNNREANVAWLRSGRARKPN